MVRFGSPLTRTAENSERETREASAAPFLRSADDDAELLAVTAAMQLPNVVFRLTPIETSRGVAPVPLAWDLERLQRRWNADAENRSRRIASTSRPGGPDVDECASGFLTLDAANARLTAANEAAVEPLDAAVATWFDQVSAAKMAADALAIEADPSLAELVDADGRRAIDVAHKECKLRMQAALFLLGLVTV